MFKFLKIRKDSFGLDISDNSLRFIKLEKKRGCYIYSSGEQNFPKGILKGGEVIKEEEFIKIIKDFVSKNKAIKTKNVIASLPEEKSYIQIISMPKMSHEDLKTAIIFEAENYIPVAIEEVYLDFEIIDNHEDHMNVLIAALPKTTVDPYFSALKKAGLKPLVLEIESLAVSRALLHKDERPVPPTLLVDFGGNKTSFIIYSNNTILFTSSFVISSDRITEDISRVLEVSEAKAENSKRKLGIEDKQDSKTKEIILKEIDKLTYQIKRHADYYTNHDFKDENEKSIGKIERVILTGGGSKLKGLVDHLVKETKLKIDILDPCDVLNEKKCKAKNDTCYSYSTALGLALRGELEKENND
jgi:type IV pilus assembly protein PilM